MEMCLEWAVETLYQDDGPFRPTNMPWRSLEVTLKLHMPREIHCGTCVNISNISFVLKSLRRANHAEHTLCIYFY